MWHVLYECMYVYHDTHRSRMLDSISDVWLRSVLPLCIPCKLHTYAQLYPGLGPGHNHDVGHTHSSCKSTCNTSGKSTDVCTRIQKLFHHSCTQIVHTLHLSRALMSACLCNSSLTTSTCPSHEARCRGVRLS